MLPAAKAAARSLPRFQPRAGRAPALATGLALVALLAARHAAAEDEAHLERDVVLIVKVRGDGGDARIELPLPSRDGRQELVHERFRLRGFGMAEKTEGGNRVAVLTYPRLSGEKRITYKARIRTRPVSHTYAPPPLERDELPDEVASYVVPTPQLQSRSPLIRQQLMEYALPRLAGGEKDIVRITWDLVSERFQRSERGANTVLKAARRATATELGLERLFCTYLRTAGVPARMVGGFALDPAPGRRFTRWVEAWVGDRWIPFSVGAGWFAEMPPGYVKMFHGHRFIARSGVASLRYKVIVR